MTRHTRLPVAVLGASELVGQHYVDLLAHHPWFELVALAMPEMPEPYEDGPSQETTWWRADAHSPAAASLPLLACRPEALPAEVQIVFSALPPSHACDIEEAFAQAGKVVFSNAHRHRLNANVPLVVADVNPWHLFVVGQQRKMHGRQGCIVYQANATTTILALALAPLHVFGIRRVLTVSYQPMSDASSPEVPAWEHWDNAIPLRADEEATIEEEMGKLFGEWDAQHGFRPASFPLSAHCACVPASRTFSGHLGWVMVELEHSVDPEQMIAAWQCYLPETIGRELPSAPQRSLVYLQDDHSPQSVLDWPTENGMTVRIGRLSPCSAFGEAAYSFWVGGSHLGRGAAASCLLNAELFVARGYLKAWKQTLEPSLAGGTV